jgi:hypothetical protein
LIHASASTTSSHGGHGLQRRAWCCASSRSTPCIYSTTT